MGIRSDLLSTATRPHRSNLRHETLVLWFLFTTPTLALAIFSAKIGIGVSSTPALAPIAEPRGLADTSVKSNRPKIWRKRQNSS